MTHGASPTRWSGRPPPPRRATTSPRSRGSGPSGRPSTCTTRTSGRAGTGTLTTSTRSEPARESRGLSLPRLRRLLRRLRPGVLALLARPDRHDRARAGRLPGLPDGLLHTVHRPQAAGPAGGRPRGRGRRGRWRAGLLQPAQLVAAVRRPGRRASRDRRRGRLVDVPDRGAGNRAVNGRIRFRVLPGPLLALALR